MTVKDVDDLYELPLDEFTEARNRLAKESDDKSIAKLRKPSAAAWALNQAARKSKGDVARFLHAAANVRNSADRAALAELRHTEGDVRRAAQAALGDRSSAQLAAINSLLATAASDEDVAEILRAGRLAGDEQANADGFVGMVAPDGAKTAKKKPPKDEVKEARERKARDEARRKHETADAAAKEAEEEAARLEREAEDAADKAARLRARAETARGKADKARQKADGLKP